MLTTRLVPLQVRVGQGHAQHLGLWHGGVHKLRAQIVVADAFDAPAHALRAVGAVGIGWAKHGQALPPPTVDGVLHHGFLLACALHHHQQCFVALSLVEAFFFAYAHHGAGIGAIRAAAQGHLIHDGRAIDQPADHADIGPVECSADPVGLRQHAHDFAVGVLADLAHQGLAVGLGHPFAGFNAAIGVDAGVKGRLQGAVLCVQGFGDGFQTGRLGVVGTVRDAE